MCECACARVLWAIVRTRVMTGRKRRRQRQHCVCECACARVCCGRACEPV